jgi:hypothetical protein
VRTRTDSVQRHGLAGQAKEMRGEPNAIGVATKRAPSTNPKAFFDDSPVPIPSAAAFVGLAGLFAGAVLLA